MAVRGAKVLVGSLSGDPAMIVGKRGRSDPVVMSTACISQRGWSGFALSSTLAVKYAVPVLGSTVGVAVIPTSGTRSPQPSAATDHDGPTSRFQRTAPVTGFSPYALSASVTTISVFLATTGWA